MSVWRQSKNECYRLVLPKSLMMLSALTSCFDFLRLRSQFQFLLVRRQTADDQSDREASRVKNCRKEASMYILPPSKQRSWWDAVQTHQIDKISCATPHSSNVAAPTRHSNTRTQTLLGSITTTMEARRDAKPREHSQSLRHKRTVPATATIHTRSTVCASRASGRLTKAGLLRHRNAHVNVHG